MNPDRRDDQEPEKIYISGIDAVQISPTGKGGHTHLNVVIILFTKLVFLEPIKGVTAFNSADTIWKYWSMYGDSDVTISDKGPDLDSQSYEQLTK